MQREQVEVVMVAGKDGAAPRQRAAQVGARGSQQVRALSGSHKCERER